MTIRSIQKMVPLMALTVLVSTGLQAAPFEEYRPTWTVGQAWAIEVIGKTQPKKLGIKNPPPFVARWATVTCGFVVEKMVEVEGDPCWCIRIDFLKEKKGTLYPRPCYRVYYRVSDSTLKRVESLNDKGDKFIAEKTYFGGPAIAEIWAEPVPMAFPFFLADSEKYSPKPEIRKDGTKRYKSYEAHQTCRIIEEKVGGEQKELLNVYIKEKDEVKEQEGLAAVQIWEKGMPWWSETTETRNGSFRYKARLISIDGKKLENPRPWNLGPANASEEGKKGKRRPFLGMDGIGLLSTKQVQTSIAKQDPIPR